MNFTLTAILKGDHCCTSCETCMVHGDVPDADLKALRVHHGNVAATHVLCSQCRMDLVNLLTDDLIEKDKEAEFKENVRCNVRNDLRKEGNSVELLELFATKEEFNKFKDVQRKGTYSMLDNRAKIQTGITTEKYMYILQNYKRLYELYENKEAELDV